MTIFITTFIAVFLLGFQQKNVQHNQYKMAAVTSVAIACSQFFMFRAAIAGATYDWILMGIGGAIGITLSMYVHKKFTGK